MTLFSAVIGASEIFPKLYEYLSYKFVQNALFVTVLISISAALLGVILVLKRYSLLGDGLSHVAFGAATVAATLGILDLEIVALPVTVLAAILILMLPGKKIMGDAAVAILSAGALAIGYTVMRVGGGEANIGGDVCTALFGSQEILASSTSDIIITASIAIILILLTFIFRHRLFSVTFDERVAKATGEKTLLYDLAFAIITSTVIVIGMNLAGALLISSLIIFPAMSAMRVCKSFRLSLLISPIFAAFGAVLGVILSIILETPVGATVAGADILIYAIISLIKKRS